MESAVERAIDVIQVRFGAQALGRTEVLPAVEPWPSGVAPLDRLTRIGGLPRGRLSLLSGRGSCGKTSLGLALLAAATHQFASTAVIDAGRSFDPWSLSAYRPAFDNLALVRPPGADACGEAATALAKAGAGFLLLLLPARVANAADPWLPLLCSAAEKSGCVAVSVVEAAPRPLAHASSFSVEVERLGWVREHGELVGLRARLTCVKLKLGLPGLAAEVEIRHPLGPGLVPQRVLSEVVDGAWNESLQAASAVG